MKQLIVLDYDGLIIDSSQEGKVRAKVIAERRLGIRVNGAHEKLLNDTWGKTGVAVFQESFGISEEVAKVLYEDLVAWDHEEPFGLVAGAEQVLEHFMQKNVPMAILTNRSSENIHASLTQYGLHPYFQFVFGCGTYPKPHGRAFDPVLEKFSMKAESVAYAGDTQYDVLCGKNAGVRTVAVCTGLWGKKSFLEYGVPERDILPSIAELPTWYEEHAV